MCPTFVASGPISGPGLSAGDSVLVPSCSAVVTLFTVYPQYFSTFYLSISLSHYLSIVSPFASPGSIPTSAEASRTLPVISVSVSVSNVIHDRCDITVHGPCTDQQQHRLEIFFTLGITKDGRYSGQYVRWEAFEQGLPLLLPLHLCDRVDLIDANRDGGIGAC